MKKTLTAILALLLASMQVMSADIDKASLNARSEWMGGFARLEAADQAAKANAPAALGMYKEALDIFESVRRKYPQWNPSLLNYRINYCQKKIEEIGRKLESEVNKLSSDELLELTKSQSKKIKEMEALRDELEVRVKFLSDALLRAREEAAKSATLENTATALAAARANLERKISEQELRLKDYEKKLSKALEDSAEPQKLRAELDKLKAHSNRTEDDLKKTASDLQARDREVAQLKKELALLTKHKDDLDKALKTANELADSRKNDLADAKRSLKVSEERLATKDKQISSRDEEVAKMRKQLDSQLQENEELKRANKGKIANDIAVADKKLKAEYEKLNERYALASNDLKERGAEIDKLRKELDKERANGILKEEKNAELVGQLSELKGKNFLAENQNLKLSAELQELKILQDKTKADIKSYNSRIKKADEQDKELGEIKSKLQTQIELAKKQESQLASQVKEMLKITKEKTEVQVKLDDSLKQAKKLQERNSLLEKRISLLTKGSKDKPFMPEELEAEIRGQLKQSQDNLEAARKENAEKDKEIQRIEKQLLESREKYASLVKKSAGGQLSAEDLKEITSVKKMSELEKELREQQKTNADLLKQKEEFGGISAKNKELEGQLLFVMNELSAKNKTIEHNAKLAEEREAFYKQQMKERDELLSSYENSTANKNWLDKIKTLSAKLDAESKKRMALEATLVDLESKLEEYEEADPKDKKGEPEASKSTAAQEADIRISRERERKNMVRNYLKQGSDSELQNKPEAAIYNYQKALELDSENSIALQRLGIIAARQGNDQDTVKYLKQAFKFDTDNLDTLLALGFAQARLGQSNWAVAYLGRAVALNPNNAYAAKIYGSALFNLGWTQAAETQLKSAHRLNQKDPEAPYNLAVLYATAEPPNLKEAAKWYKIAVDNGAQRDPGLDEALK